MKYLDFRRKLLRILLDSCWNTSGTTEIWPDTVPEYLSLHIFGAAHEIGVLKFFCPRESKWISDNHIMVYHLLNTDETQLTTQSTYHEFWASIRKQRMYLQCKPEDILNHVEPNHCSSFQTNDGCWNLIEFSIIACKNIFLVRKVVDVCKPNTEKKLRIGLIWHKIPVPSSESTAQLLN